MNKIHTLEARGLPRPGQSQTQCQGLAFLSLEEIGEGDVGPWHRLHGKLTVGGYDLHVTAVAVCDAGNAIAEAEDDQIDIDDLNSMTGDGELSTITIDGRDYVLWMVPYRD